MQYMSAIILFTQQFYFQLRNTFWNKVLANSSFKKSKMADCLVVIVTGGAEGLGAAICQVLLRQGYKVCVADIQEPKGKSFVQKQQKVFGSENVIFSLCDVTKESDYESTFDLTIKFFQKVDVLINNAGILLEEDPRKCLDVNLMGPIYGCQLALKYMGKTNGGNGGMVICTASLDGFVPCHRCPIYVATKHGVIGLARSYGSSSHFLREGIVFAALCPSVMDTELLRRFTKKRILNSTSVSFVAEGVLKLLKDRINGSTLLVWDENMQYIEVQEELKGFHNSIQSA